MSALYLYSLLDGPPRGPGVKGLRGERLRFVRGEGFFVAAGLMAAAPPLTARALRGHDAAIRRLAATAHAVLPFRFGSLVPDERGLTALFGSSAAVMRDALALVAGREQMTLRVSGEPSAPPAPPPPSPDPLGAGARYLERRLRAHASASAVPEIDPLRAVLGAIVKAERVERHEASRPLLASVYHLIPRGQAAAYVAAVQAGARMLVGVRVAASGPWAPYAFAPEPFA